MRPYKGLLESRNRRRQLLQVLTSASATQIFGERIRELRQKRGLTQVELSELSGYPQGRISEIERGSRTPTLMTMIRLAIALDCYLTQLVAPFRKSDLRVYIEK